MALVDGELRRRRVTHLPTDEWRVCLRDYHPAYLTWEEFMANQEKLRSNRPAGHLKSPDRRGAAREGGALLQGLVLCGRCGHRMYSRYYGPDSHSAYECRRSGYKDGTMVALEHERERASRLEGQVGGSMFDGQQWPRQLP